METKSVVERCLENERQNFSVYAFRTADTKGREKPVLQSNVRTEFQRDRDKITHCQSFRRLMYKTQVFLSPTGDHYRTRMTHTLEVTQIARIIARALRLNEDLTESAALGHDLGHTPFGHAGERAMQRCFDSEFTHYKQSLRVVDILENDGNGLNLTWEVRDGIVNHTGKNMASTLEGIIVKYADRIAYINHDIDDACRAGILSERDIPLELRSILGETHSDRINTMVMSIVNESEGRPKIAMSPEIGAATDALRAFLFDRVYHNPVAKSEEGKAEDMLSYLFEYYVKHPEKLPELYKRRCGIDSVERCACDFISGMTDRYAIEVYTDLCIPKVWRGIQ
jgi:dGTPase